MSVGQAIGGAVGAVAGFFMGGPAGAIYGAQIGITAGGYIDPPPGPHSEGPRLSDMTVQTSTYGAGKTRAYGTVAVTGNVFWLEGDKYVEHAHEQESGGKGGGGGATQTTYTYSATFAVALTEGQEISGIRRLWVGDRLIYDAGSDNVESIIASNSGHGFLAGSDMWNEISTWWINALMTGQTWKLYTGADDQEAEPRMQADKGAANVSAYPGRAYIVFYDLDLTEHYSNSLMAAQVKAEVVVAAPIAYQNNEVSTLFTGNLGDPTYGDSIRLIWMQIGAGGANYITLQENNFDGNFHYLYFGSIEFPYLNESSRFDISLLNYGYAVHMPYVCQSDEAVAFSGQVQFSGFTAVLARWYYPGSTEQWDDYLGDSRLIFDNDFVVFSGGETFLGGNGSVAAYIVSLSRASKTIIKSTAAAYAITWMGVSENYLFAVKHGTPAGQTVVYKFSRVDLSLAATYTQSVNAGILHVIDDDTFYSSGWSASGGNKLYKWVGGVVVEQLSGVISGTGSHALHVANGEQLFGYEMPVGSGTRSLRAFSEVIDDTPASLRDIVTYECGLAGLLAADLDLVSLTDSAVRGYRVTGISAPRAALEPLQAAWPFDVYQKGYKVGFKSRGSASVATIDEVDLGAGGDASAVLLPVSREMETQIARTVTVKHLDMDRDYEIGEQTAPERPGVSSVEPRQVDLPIVLTETEAMQIADVLNAKEWVERVRFGPFSLPPTYAGLEPTDVVTINHKGRAWTVRLTRVEYLPDGRLNCDAVLTASAAYSSSATGASPIVLGQSLVPLSGSSRVVLLDIPRIDAAQDVPGVSAVMYGFTGSWPGGVLVRSDDQGQTWQTMQGFNNKARAFTVAETGSAATSYSIDHATVLTLTPAHDAAALYSITEDQLYAHQNLAAWGIDGRWEIVAFKTVTDNTGTYMVKDFRRGLYGTEWATGLHAAADSLVMLDTTTAGFIGLPASVLGSARLWRAVTNGNSINSAANLSQTYNGINIKPLCPIDLNGNRDPVSLDWTITWSRRSRQPVELLSGFPVPIGENNELYEVDIFDSGYATIKRTVTGLATPSLSYSSANQIADFSANPSTLYLDIYQISSVSGRGKALRQSITRVVPVDPYIDYLVLGLHFDGVNGSQTITDLRGHTVEVYGNAQLSTDAAAFGGISCLFDGAGDYLRILNAADLQFATDWTLDGFLTFTSLATDQQIFEKRSALQARGIGLFFQASDKKLYFSVGDSNTAAWEVNISSAALSASTRYHVQIAKGGTTYYMFINGALAGSSVWAGTPADSTSNLLFGIAYNLATAPLNGRLDDWRLTNYCRNTTAFTPRIIAFSDT